MGPYTPSRPARLFLGLGRPLSLAAALALAVAPTAQALAPAAGPSQAELDACQARDEASFRAAIEAVTTSALRKGVSDVDYKAAVADEWRKGGLDDLIDKRVEIAIAEVREETSTADRLRSIANADTAKALAEKVAERVYRSDALKSAIETLITGVGHDVGKRIELATQDAAEPAVACLRAFLGPRYGDAVARAVGANAARDFGLSPGKGGAELGSGSVIANSSEGIAGAAILLVRRQLANMAGRIGQRLAGSVLSRLVSVAAGGVGLVLIAKDLWDLTGGVFPIISTEMKSKDTKLKVQEELAKSIGDQIGEHVKEIGAKSAERVVEVWQEFRRAHLKALELAEKNADFKKFLDTLNPRLMPRLNEVVSLLMAEEGEAGILKRMADGTLLEAVDKLPEAALGIAREMRSIDAGLKWAALAGDDLPQVVDLGLYKRAKPEAFTRAGLARILALGDRGASGKLAGITTAARDNLMDLQAAELKNLARSLNEQELETLARYLTGLQKEPREAVLKAVAASPAKMQRLASDRVRDAILASRDQGAAVTMMLRDGGAIDPLAVARDLRDGWDGRIAPQLVLEKHPGALIGLGVAALVLLLMLRRLFRPRTRRPGGPSAGAPPAAPAAGPAPDAAGHA